MEWSYLVLGDAEVTDDPRGIVVEFNETHRQAPPPPVRIVPSGTTFIAQAAEAPAHRSRERAVPRPFEKTTLGSKYRLSWPNGAMPIGHYAHVGGWGERFAIVPDDRGFSVIDASSARVARLVLPADSFRMNLGPPIISAGRVWLAIAGGAITIPTGELEALVAGAVAVTLVRHYPVRKPEARLGCVFVWFTDDGAMVEIGAGDGGAKEPKLEIPLARRPIKKYTPVTLLDELWPSSFAAIDIQGERVELMKLEARTHTYEAKITVTGAKDPIRVAKPASNKTPDTRRSTKEVGRLVEAILANPEDDAQRAVLSDLLLELEDPSANAIAKLRADGKASRAKLHEAMGPLGIYLTNVVTVGGFPVEATMARDAPDPSDFPGELDAACADFRLGMIHTLHTQPRADPTIYARLLEKARSLRRADVSDRTAIDALIAAKRKLVYLEHVDFAEADSMRQLATPTFDHVTTVHTVVGLAHLQPLVNRIAKDAAKFFARAPRALVLEETRDRNKDLVRTIRKELPRLPITSVTVGEVTIER